MDDFQPIKLACEDCKTEHLKLIKAVKPEDFINPKNATVLTQFWCSKCGKPQAFRLKFTRMKDDTIKMEVTKRIDAKSLLVPNSDKPDRAISARPKQKSMRGGRDE